MHTILLIWDVKWRSWLHYWSHLYLQRCGFVRPGTVVEETHVGRTAEFGTPWGTSNSGNGTAHPEQCSIDPRCRAGRTGGYISGWRGRTIPLCTGGTWPERPATNPFCCGRNIISGFRGHEPRGRSLGVWIYAASLSLKGTVHKSVRNNLGCATFWSMRMISYKINVPPSGFPFRNMHVTCDSDNFGCLVWISKKFCP